MPKRTILHVESAGPSPDVADGYHRWYDEVHIPEMLTIEGFVAARRFVPAEGDGPYIAQYEIEGDPGAALKRLRPAAADGTLHMADTVRLDPPPRMTLLELVTERDAASG